MKNHNYTSLIEPFIVDEKAIIRKMQKEKREYEKWRRYYTLIRILDCTNVYIQDFSGKVRLNELRKGIRCVYSGLGYLGQTECLSRRIRMHMRKKTKLGKLILRNVSRGFVFDIYIKSTNPEDEYLCFQEHKEECRILRDNVLNSPRGYLRGQPTKEKSGGAGRAMSL